MEGSLKERQALSMYQIFILVILQGALYTIDSSPCLHLYSDGNALSSYMFLVLISFPRPFNQKEIVGDQASIGTGCIPVSNNPS